MKFMTVGEVAKTLSLSGGQVRRLIASGKLQAVNVGTNNRNHWRVPEKALEALCKVEVKAKSSKGDDAKKPLPSDRQMILAAKRIYHDEGRIEVDPPGGDLPKSRVSRGRDGGAYVMAWVWVDDEDAKEEKGSQPDEESI